MKKAKQSRSKEYTISRIYKENIEQLVDIFQDNGTTTAKSKIKIGRYEISDKSDIDKLKSTIRKDFVNNISAETSLEIVEAGKSRFERISLEINKFSTRIYISDDDDAYLLGKMTKLENIVSARSKAQRFIISWNLVLPSFFLIIILSAISLFLPTDALRITLSILTLPFVVITFSSIIVRNQGTRAYLINSDEMTNFFKRNKDQIILAVTFTVLGTIIGSVITAIILQILFPKTH